MKKFSVKIVDCLCSVVVKNVVSESESQAISLATKICREDGHRGIQVLEVALVN